MKRIDLNCDMGEGFGAYSFGQDERLLPYISSANIACGFHAGDPHIMASTVRLCMEAGVAIGAHPGLPDRLGFGRRHMSAAPDEVYDYMLYQIGALSAFVRAQGGSLRHVKPHGALYHMAGHDAAIAAAIVRAIAALDPSLIVYAQAGSLLLREARRAKLRTASEAFADRTYRSGGVLTPRTEQGALIAETEVAVKQVLTIITKGYAVSRDGDRIPLQADTVCLHGDAQAAVAFAAALRCGLEQAGIAILAPDYD